MQFTCDSCKTVLQIADDKVRGKRLIVRCKRCGAKISIADPQLAAAPPSAPPKAAPPPSRPPPAARAPAPSAPPRARPAPEPDPDSTRAMDSAVLERALEASKRAEPAAAPAIPQRPPAPPVSAPRDPPIWFAMIGGNQTGPMSLQDVRGRVDDASIGPRTYMWKDGMAGWQRAKDLPEMAGLFAPPSADAGVESAPAEPSGASASGFREFSTSDFSSATLEAEEVRREVPSLRPRGAERAAPEFLHSPDPAADEAVLPVVDGEPLAPDPAPGAPLELTSLGGGELPLDTSPSPPVARPEPSSQPPRRRPPTGPLFMSQAERSTGTRIWPIILAALVGAAAWAGWSAWSSSQHGAAKPQAETSPAPAKPPEPVQAAPAPPPPVAQTGLTAEQVRRTLDQNKRALQGCIDDALRREPNLRVGKIHIATTIAPDGKVKSATIDKTAVDGSSLGTCLKRVTQRIAFPSFRGDPFDVDIPIVVTAGD